jgi:APA family basic amino acid/polyamine antiporter
MLRDRLDVADSVVAGLGAMVGAGLFAGLAPASALVGGWLPVALVIAAVPALLAACSGGPQAHASGGHSREPLGRWPARTSDGLYLTSRAAAAAAVAGCFGEYVAPARPALPALAVLALAVVADILDVRPSRLVTRVLTIFVLVVLALVVAACFAIPPPAPTGIVPPPGTPGLDRPGALLPAAGVLFFAFLGVERVTEQARRRTVVITVLLALGTYLAVGVAVLRQLGPTRLAVSAVPLRDALDAADAALLDPVVSVAAMVATAVGLLLVVGAGRRAADTRATGDRWAHGRLARVFVGGGAALGVLVAGPDQTIELAATCALFHYAFATVSTRLESRADPARTTWTVCAGMLSSVLIAMTMPPVDLLIALAVAVLAAVAGPLLGRVVRR